MAMRAVAARQQHDKAHTGRQLSNENYWFKLHSFEQL
jgi:hypothetical protein